MSCLFHPSSQLPILAASTDLTSVFFLCCKNEIYKKFLNLKIKKFNIYDI